MKDARGARDALETMESLGIHPDKPKKGESPLDVIDSIEEALNFEDDENLGLVTYNNKRRAYSIDDKVLALMFLDAFQRDLNGKMTPKFTYVSKLFGYPKKTIEHWWNQRNDLQKQQSLILNKGFDVIQLRMMGSLMKMTESMNKIDFDKMVSGSSADMKNFVGLLNTLVNKLRLLSNLSTTNVSHHHKGGVEMIVPED